MSDHRTDPDEVDLQIRAIERVARATPPPSPALQELGDSLRALSRWMLVTEDEAQSFGGVLFERWQRGLEGEMKRHFSLPQLCHLKFEENPSLGTIGGFDVLVDVGSELKLSQNSVLTDIGGLFGVGSVGTHLKLENNSLLPTVGQCEALRDAIGVANIGGSVIITGNGPG